MVGHDYLYRTKELTLTSRFVELVSRLFTLSAHEWRNSPLRFLKYALN